MRHISVLSTLDSRITCIQTLQKTAWVLRWRNDVRMESTRDIFDLLPSCRGKCSLPKLDTRFENSRFRPSC